MSRRRRAGVVAALLAAAAGVVTGIVTVASGGRESGEQTRAAYLAEVAAICETYGRQLDEIPPPSDPASPGAVFESIGRALPILREQAQRLRVLEAPAELALQIDRFFALTDQSIVALERARHEAGRRALFPMVQAIAAFEAVRDKAKNLARAIGFRC